MRIVHKKVLKVLRSYGGEIGHQWGPRMVHQDDQHTTGTYVLKSFSRLWSSVRLTGKCLYGNKFVGTSIFSFVECQLWKEDEKICLLNVENVWFCLIECPRMFCMGIYIYAYSTLSVLSLSHRSCIGGFMRNYPIRLHAICQECQTLSTLVTGHGP